MSFSVLNLLQCPLSGYKLTLFDGKIHSEAFFQAHSAPSKPLCPPESESRRVFDMSCVPRRATASPDCEPPRAGDNQTKSASTLERMAGPIAFLSCDRYAPHVSQLWTHHLGGAERMRRGEGMGRTKATRALPPTTLSAGLSPRIEIDISRTSCCLIPSNLGCVWRREMSRTCLAK